MCGSEKKRSSKRKKTKQIKKENSSSVSSNSDTDDDNDVDSWQELTTKSKQKDQENKDDEFIKYLGERHERRRYLNLADPSFFLGRAGCLHENATTH